ncbi:MAG: glycosyltransferase family 4 protein [Kiritimatiellia bacterium]|jgi:glycosyltransferase involved in cell wall biosynthesis|nr:glycosyltransferase family 4 protein [Kiritimatiellia bacterium]MDP6847713.1 glycosyltransferase family 4 protein [Kiritimatiellia bacterium]
MSTARVAILHYSAPPLVGGVEFIIEAHARMLAEFGCETKLIVGEGGHAVPGVTVDLIPEISSGGGQMNEEVEQLLAGKVPDNFKACVKKVEKELSKSLRNIDVCIMHNVLTMHFNLILTAALANIMERRKNIHFIGWTHDSTFADPNYKEHQKRSHPWRLLTKKLPGCDYCVISAQRRQEMKKIFGVSASQLPIIPDGLDVRELLGLTPGVTTLFINERLNQKDFVALTPTRIVRRKNLEEGIRIVAALKRFGKTVRWMITGAPDTHNTDAYMYYEELIALRKKMRVEKDVIFLWEHFKSGVSNEDLRGLYGISNTLLFPSEREGFGIPVLEAGIMGLLVVISDIPALREIGGMETVYIYPDERAEDVACRMVRAFDRSAQLVFRKKIISTYSWDALFDQKILPAVFEPEQLWKKRRPKRKKK